jgi:hypothetical protein
MHTDLQLHVLHKLTEIQVNLYDLLAEMQLLFFWASTQSLWIDPELLMMQVATFVNLS